MRLDKIRLNERNRLSGIPHESDTHSCGGGIRMSHWEELKKVIHFAQR